MELRAALEHMEALGPSEGDAAAAIGYAAAASLALDASALAGPIRRSLLLLAAGGDPHRELDPDGRAVRALADELETLVPAPDLDAVLASVHAGAQGLPRLETAAAAIAADPASARRALALALLAAELSDEANPAG